MRSLHVISQVFIPSNAKKCLSYWNYRKRILFCCTTQTQSEFNYGLLFPFTLVAVVVVNPLLPAYWGESVSVALWGFAASFSRQSSSRAATPEDPSTYPGPTAWCVSVGN